MQWNAYFTTGVPHEALHDFLVALDASAVPDSGFEEPEAVVTALSAQGWIRDVDRPRIAATDPGFASHVSLEMLPDLIADADLWEDLMGWQAWAEPTLGAPYLWCANFSPSVPHELVAIFASSLASRSRWHATGCRRARRKRGVRPGARQPMDAVGGRGGTMHASPRRMPSTGRKQPPPIGRCRQAAETGTRVGAPRGLTPFDGAGLGGWGAQEDWMADGE